MPTSTMEKNTHKVVSPAEWLAARKEFLKKEKELVHLRDKLSRQRRELPWERVQKNYTFEGEHGAQSLPDLFDGRTQLVVYHFMFGPGWKEGCPSCSFLADSFDGMTLHLAQRDTSFVAISRASWPEIEAFKKRMGWKFAWLSSFGTDFNYDFHVSFTKEEMTSGKAFYNYETMSFPSEEGPGASVFYRQGSEIFHTYSTFARGLDAFLQTYNFLDLTPKGRDEDSLSFPMAWIRHHDRYPEGKIVDIKKLTKTSA